MRPIEDVCVNLLDYFGELDDDPDAIFGEYPEVGPREWDGEAVSFTVSGNGNAIRITIAPEGTTP